MIEIICGEKGKGKTKELLARVNSTVTTATGNIVYLDKSQKHMYELSNKVRLINVMDYPLSNCDEFLGFICGIISQDNDLEEMYLDSFLTIASIEDEETLIHAIETLDIVSEKYKVRFVLSISKNKEDLPDSAKARVVVAI
ncbi:MAG: twitching motility protein PilT [Clostridiales bacterium]|nr:twitching motility protein PilT [Clostridiales bacterium]